MNNTKAQSLTLGAIGGLAIMLVVGIITSSIGARILNVFQGTLTDNTVPENITQQAQTGLQNFADFYPVIGLVIVAAIVLSLVRSFGG